MVDLSGRQFEYATCSNCNALLTKRFVEAYGNTCSDCHKPLGRKIGEAL